MCHVKENWIEILPTVLLGLRTCFKEDLNSSPAEMLINYGSTLRIPGEFFIEEDLPSDPEIFIEQHRIHMRIKSRPTAIIIRKLLSFIKIYTINDYLFTIDISGKTVNITIKRLKLAFLPKEIDTPTLWRLRHLLLLLIHLLRLLRVNNLKLILALKRKLNSQRRTSLGGECCGVQRQLQYYQL
ncbi:hypothetical protein ACFW04_014263 [Cataglyphis niger]